MLKEVVEEHCVSPKVLGVARLDGFRMDFFGHSKKWDGATESIVKDARESTWGILYELDFPDAEDLDAAMDVRLDGTGLHFHYPVDVALESGEVSDALMYVMSEMGPFRPPSYEYLKRMVWGARERGLPKAYVERLHSMPNTPASYPVPRLPRMPVLPGCDGCTDWREELRTVGA
jgi:cation transport regulator ChaC